MTMIEKVARAIDQQVGTKRIDRLEIARAAIEAMQEPTEEMLEAADKSNVYAEGYRNMINAALNRSVGK